jgi:hypothetical protein
MVGPPPHRSAVAPDRALAVFLIGMRVNRWHRPDVWIPAVRAMRPMLAELYDDTDSGFLGHRSTLSSGGPLLVQYWRCAVDVQRYARDADHRHRPAWSAFYARARKAPRAVGVWHELYDVAPGAAQATYVEVPFQGLAKALAEAPDAPA